MSTIVADFCATRRRRGREREGILARAVHWHLDDRALVYRDKTVIFD